MNSKQLIRSAHDNAALVAGLLALLAIGVGGQNSALAGSAPPLPSQFSGLINDYTPTTDTNTNKAIGGSPYEMHGRWTLDLNYQRSAATFSAELTMETSEAATASSVFDPVALGAHTHHISMTNGVVHNLPNDWATMCTSLGKTPAKGGFVVTGPAYVTGNGSNPAFGNPTNVTVCILGGISTGIPGTAYVEFSTLTLTFSEPAASHFGALPIHGVVTRCGGQRGFEQSQKCDVAVQ